MDMVSYLMGAKSGGGGGGSLPPVTAADVGSALVVKQVAVPGAVIVPEQTVTTVMGDYFGEASLSGVVSSLVAEGVACVVQIDGATYEWTATEDLIVCAPDGTTGFDFYENFFWSEEAGTYTVAVYVADYTYEYGLDPYPGYDLVIGVVGNLDSSEWSSLCTFEVLKGDLDDVLHKLRNTIPVHYTAFGVRDYGDGCYDSYVTAGIRSIDAPGDNANYVSIQLWGSPGSSLTRTVYWTSSGITTTEP